MWAKASAADRTSRYTLVCDECGAAYRPERSLAHDRRASWHSANIAGWARIARAPDRHICASC
jgi:hypothetical protein